ncbi:hypothetical protein GWK51_14480 [Acinetobacter sp. PS-1]|nr:hypothetical protein [Acinetobacter kanungonis]
MFVFSNVFAEENESKTCENLKNSAYQIMLERQSGTKLLDLLESLLKPLDGDTVNAFDNYYTNNFFSHVTGLAYELPIYLDESEKQMAAIEFGSRIKRICLKDNTALFAPVRFQTFDE